jgi:isochorismate pyruvate lyase
MTMAFERAFSGAPWEGRFAYCRALRAGDRVFVTGSVALDDEGGVYAPGDARAQTRRCFEIVEKALADLGAGLDDVVRTRMLVTDISRMEEFGAGHRDVFDGRPPCTTMVEVSALVDPGFLIEVEVDAVVMS